MLKKGIVFSLDAMFAIVIATIMVLACFFCLSKTTTNLYKDLDIYKISSDSLTVVEKDGTLKAAVETVSTDTLQMFLDSLSGQYCANISIYTSLSEEVSSVLKAGCVPKNESSFVIRNFIADGADVYYARIEAWYK